MVLRVIIFSIEYLVRTHLFPQTQTRTLTPPHYDTRCDPSKEFMILSIEYLVRTDVFTLTHTGPLTTPHND